MMMADIERGQDIAIQEDRAAPSIVDRIMELASLPGVNPEMAAMLIQWQDRERSSQAEERFNNAMNHAQAEIEPVARTAENTQTKSFYAKLEAVDEAIRPIYLRHGFNVAYNTIQPLTPGNIRVECEVSLGRHSKKYYREAPADTLGPKGSAVKTVLHGGGSTETYLKRYAVCGAFNVVFRNQDDDGQRGGKKFLTPDQAAELVDLIAQAGFDERSWVERRTAGVAHSVDEIEVPQFVILKNMLEQTIAQRAAKKG
jgi:ERF superfamily